MKKAHVPSVEIAQPCLVVILAVSLQLSMPTVDANWTILDLVSAPPRGTASADGRILVMALYLHVFIYISSFISIPSPLRVILNSW